MYRRDETKYRAGSHWTLPRISSFRTSAAIVTYSRPLLSLLLLETPMWPRMLRHRTEPRNKRPDISI